MLEASFSLSPVANVDFCLSLPAKSTKFSFECFISTVLFYSDLVTKLSVKIECDLDEFAFIFVSFVVLAAIPSFISTPKSFRLSILREVNLSMKKPFLTFYRTARIYSF